MVERGTYIAENNFDEFLINRFPLKDFENYIGVRNKKIVNEIVVNHVTPRISMNSLINEDILTLPKVLVEKTELSQYLNSIGFNFGIENNCIMSSRYGKTIDWSKLNLSNMLMRFGGKNSLYDYNINGYLFPNYIPFDECRGWLGSPEILKSISNAYNDKSIADNYAEKAENYMLSFKVNLNDFDIGGTKDNLPASEKGDILLKYTLNALACDLHNKKQPVQYFNPHILLDRNYVVPNSQVIKITRTILDESNSYIMSDKKSIK